MYIVQKSYYCLLENWCLNNICHFNIDVDIMKVTIMFRWTFVLQWPATTFTSSWVNIPHNLLGQFSSVTWVTKKNIGDSCNCHYIKFSRIMQVTRLQVSCGHHLRTWNSTPSPNCSSIVVTTQVLKSPEAITRYLKMKTICWIILYLRLE